jgi:hypothetical protein
MKNCLLLWLGAFLCLTQANAQNLTVSQPIDGAVYQQNEQGQGRIIIRGDFNSRSFLGGGIYCVS